MGYDLPPKLNVFENKLSYPYRVGKGLSFTNEIDMAPFISESELDNSSNTKYELHALLLQSTLPTVVSYGHFQAIVKIENISGSHEWFRYDDTNVQREDERGIFNLNWWNPIRYQVYGFIYKRME